MVTNHTRYQILFDKSSKVENFTARERSQFERRCKELHAAGVKFTTWDTRKNSLSSLFRF